MVSKHNNKDTVNIENENIYVVMRMFGRVRINKQQEEVLKIERFEFGGYSEQQRWKYCRM